MTWHAYEEMEITRKINLQNMFAHWNVTGLLSISESPQAAGCLPILAILCPHPVWPVCCIWHSPPLPPPAWQSCRTWTLRKWGWDSTVNFLLSQMYLAGFFSLLTYVFFTMCMAHHGVLHKVLLLCGQKGNLPVIYKVENRYHVWMPSLVPHI